MTYKLLHGVGSSSIPPREKTSVLLPPNVSLQKEYWAGLMGSCPSFCLTDDNLKSVDAPALVFRLSCNNEDLTSATAPFKLPSLY